MYPGIARDDGYFTRRLCLYRLRISRINKMAEGKEENEEQSENFWKQILNEVSNQSSRRSCANKTLLVLGRCGLITSHKLPEFKIWFLNEIGLGTHAYQPHSISTHNSLLLAIL